MSCSCGGCFGRWARARGRMQPWRPPAPRHGLPALQPQPTAAPAAGWMRWGGRAAGRTGRHGRRWRLPPPPSTGWTGCRQAHGRTLFGCIRRHSAPGRLRPGCLSEACNLAHIAPTGSPFLPQLLLAPLRELEGWLFSEMLKQLWWHVLLQEVTALQPGSSGAAGAGAAAPPAAAGAAAGGAGGHGGAMRSAKSAPFLAGSVARASSDGQGTASLQGTPRSFETPEVEAKGAGRRRGRPLLCCLHGPELAFLWRDERPPPTHSPTHPGLLAGTAGGGGAALGVGPGRGRARAARAAPPAAGAAAPPLPAAPPADCGAAAPPGHPVVPVRLSRVLWEWRAAHSSRRAVR